MKLCVGNSSLWWTHQQEAVITKFGVDNRERAGSSPLAKLFGYESRRRWYDWPEVLTGVARQSFNVTRVVLRKRKFENVESIGYGNQPRCREASCKTSEHRAMNATRLDVQSARPPDGGTHPPISNKPQRSNLSVPPWVRPCGYPL